MINFSYPLSRQDYWKLARNSNIVPFRAKNELDDWAVGAAVVKTGRIRQARHAMTRDEEAWWAAIDQGIWLVRLIRASEDDEIRGDRIASLHQWCRDITTDMATAALSKPCETVRELMAIAMEAVELTEELYPFTMDWISELECNEVGRPGN